MTERVIDVCPITGFRTLCTPTECNNQFRIDQRKSCYENPENFKENKQE